eukprot:CAMPEP_0184310420 /NCGR_PEP_ID=MMETSP1049-20130417/29594_1 /TAXON_ID=77928 /ORGANISM="Proteomonas sulcata, Strain CCMP704" /LENGTH=53 /DNA_ID=CAMNT_0026624533 /DNA_START=1 /DNA_END=158 /DNA_ORIENTATION=-
MVAPEAAAKLLTTTCQQESAAWDEGRQVDVSLFRTGLERTREVSGVTRLAERA